MKIMVTGGGSGGHILPVLAVAHELKSHWDAEIVYVGQKGDGLFDIVQQSESIDRVARVSAGKLRRYSGAGWRQLLDIKTQLLNLHDMFRTLIGIGESFRLIGREKPAVVFTRGGYVSVPVALAARLRNIPYITHDADSVPSLANRIIARWATAHAVTMPAAMYPYDPQKVFVTGIPVGANFKPVSRDDQQKFRHELQIDAYNQVILVTGGGNGARALNHIVVANAKHLLARYPDLVILHFAGRELLQETTQGYDDLSLGGARSRVKVFGFVADFYQYSGAADIVVARGGMGSLAELALQHKPCLLIPSPQLAWNVQNSRLLAEAGAVIELTEDQASQPDRLGHSIGALLDDTDQRKRLGEALGKHAKPHAAREIAELVVKVGS